MNASLYQGESRAIPRWTVVGMLIIVTLVLAETVLFQSPGVHSPINPPRVLCFPFQFRPLAAALGLFSIYGLIQFGLRRSPVKWGVAALVSLAYLKESQWALTGYEIRDIFICGGVFGGWLFGVFFSKALDARIGRANDVAREDALGEAGATGVFAAVYCGAFVTKVISSGLNWGDGGNLLASIVNRHHFSHAGGILDGYVLFVVAHPALATAFALATLSIQAGMFLYIVSPRLRMLWGALVFSFHLNAFLLMGVRYVEPMVLALVFSVPWPRVWRRLRGGSAKAPVPEMLIDAEELPALDQVTERAKRWVGVVGVVTLVLWLGIHWNDRSKHLLLPEGIWESDSPADTRPQQPGEQHPSMAPPSAPPSIAPSVAPSVAH